MIFYLLNNLWRRNRLYKQETIFWTKFRINTNILTHPLCLFIPVKPPPPAVLSLGTWKIIFRVFFLFVLLCHVFEIIINIVKSDNTKNSFHMKLLFIAVIMKIIHGFISCGIAAQDHHSITALFDCQIILEGNVF